MNHEYENLIPKKLYSHLTKRAADAIGESFELSKKHPYNNKAGYASPAHLLCALSESDGSMAKNILSKYGVSSKTILTQIKKSNDSRSMPSNAHNITFNLSQEYKKALKRAAGYAMEQGHYFIGTEHLLYGILDKEPKMPALTPKKTKDIQESLREMMLNYISLETHLGNAENGGVSFLGTDNDDYEAELQEAFSSSTKTEISDVKNNPALESFCDNLSRKAREGGLDPVIGRDAEINRVIRALSRKTKNNPLLIGDAGVGKTAIAHGLANKIQEGNVPRDLSEKTVYALNLSSLLAGTIYRGEFEERIHDLVEEAEKGDCILFIDEIHMLPGAGAAQGSLDAANILKPSLASGALQCIGATTYEEYKKTIEKDGALDRRFQKIFIKEQSPEEALNTLKALRPHYELHHNVEIENSILELCVELSSRYMPARALPDKALDVLDEAASYARSDATVKTDTKELHSLKEELESIVRYKEEALQKEHYKKALELKNKQENTESKISKLKEQDVADVEIKKINEDMVYNVISEMTSIPLQQITKKERDLFKKLE
ncbi:MAG: ATP-dependent Clp protease ATP-binding subunit [Candidatus Spechtbacterales bacterium]